MENNYTVYMHKFPNMKVYIGITNRNVEARWRKKALIGHNVSQETINKIQKAKKEHYPNGFKHTDTTKEKLTLIEI